MMASGNAIIATPAMPRSVSNFSHPKGGATSSRGNTCQSADTALKRRSRPKLPTPVPSQGLGVQAFMAIAVTASRAAPYQSGKNERLSSASTREDVTEGAIVIITTTQPDASETASMISSLNSDAPLMTWKA